jgi:hypothetical protein
MAGSPVGDAAYGTPLTAAQAYDLLVVNGQCGAHYRLDDDGDHVANSDTVDDRIFGEIGAGGGAIIDAGDAKISWPSLAMGTPLNWNANNVPVAYATANPGADIEDFIWEGAT